MAGALSHPARAGSRTPTGLIGVAAAQAVERPQHPRRRVPAARHHRRVGAVARRPGVAPFLHEQVPDHRPVAIGIEDSDRLGHPGRRLRRGRNQGRFGRQRVEVAGDRRRLVKPETAVIQHRDPPERLQRRPVNGIRRTVGERIERHQLDGQPLLFRGQAGDAGVDGDVESVKAEHAPP